MIISLIIQLIKINKLTLIFKNNNLKSITSVKKDQLTIKLINN